MAENTPAQSSGLARAAKILGIVSIILGVLGGGGIVFAIVSLILGGQCKNKGIENADTKTATTTAIIGLVISIIVSIVVGVLSSVLANGMSRYM